MSISDNDRNKNLWMILMTNGSEQSKSDLEHQIHVVKEALILDPLTEIELQICSLMYLGKTAKEIAIIRDCSYRTVERHVANIRLKIRGEKLSPAVLYFIHSSALE